MTSIRQLENEMLSTLTDGQVELYLAEKKELIKRMIQPGSQAKRVHDDAVLEESPISEWFELSYAQFLTVPRLVMESMPIEWQRQMAALLREMDETFDWRPETGRYWVMLRDERGHFTHAPLNDYRHGSIEHLRK